MRLAVEAGNSRDPEPAAWAYSQLAFYQLAGNNTGPARRSLDRALDFVPQYPPALFLRSKLELADSEPARAVETLQAAVAQSPLPEYQWALADSADLAGDRDLSVKTEKGIREHGAAEDPRSFALFLASRNADSLGAVKLAQDELLSRRDIFTYDAVAWTALAAGNIEEASANIERALNEHTVDARLLYHAGTIAAAAGDQAKAASWLERASAIQQMLHPSERADLLQQLKALEARMPLLSKNQPPNPGRQGP